MSSLRFRLLTAVVVPPVIVALVLVFTSAQKIRADKELYTYDLATQSVELLASNLQVKLEELKRIASGMEQPGAPFVQFKALATEGAGSSPAVVNASHSGRALLQLRVGPQKAALLRPQQLLDLRRQGPSQLMVLNSMGEVIAHSDPTMVPSRRKMQSLVRQLRLFKKGAARLGTKEVMREDKTCLAAFARIEGGLAVVHTIPKEQVTAAAAPLIRAAIITSSITVLVMILFALVVSRRVTRPLREMARQAEAIGRGEFDVTLVAEPAAEGAGEVGKLAKSLREMSVSLKAREDELKQVQQRLLQSERVNAAGRVIGSIAQELSEPLNASQELAEKVLSAVRGQAKAQAFADALGEQLGQAVMMLQKLRRLDVDDSAPVASVIEADLALADALLAARPMLEQRRIDAVLEPEFELRPIQMPARELQNALVDVCYFVAQRARERSKVKVSIANHQLPDDRPGVAITFSYAGDTLGEDERRALLSPLSAVEQGGTLILAVAAAAVTGAGGGLAIEPTEQGNEVRLIFPAAPGTAVVVSPSPAASAPRQDGERGNKGATTRDLGGEAGAIVEIEAISAESEWGESHGRKTNSGRHRRPTEGGS